MADHPITNKQIAELYPVLVDASRMKPPALPKGRYVLAKATDKAAPLYEAYAKEEKQLIERVAVRDENGDVEYTPLDNGRLHFDVQPELQDEYEAELKALQAKPVVLEGVRQITHAELGPCPITADQERVLIACGLLEDVEPA